MEKEERQYCSWLYMQYLRKIWKQQEHQNLPAENCSCEFQGEGKPNECGYEVNKEIAN